MKIDAAIGDGMEHVRMLVDTIGKRPTGFEGERRAAEYMCGQLDSWGLVDVATEPFEARSWDYQVCRVETDATGPREAVPVEFTASTPPEGIEAELVVFEHSGDVRAGELTGKIALVMGGLPSDEVVLGGQTAAMIVANPAKALAWNEIYGSGRPLAGKLPMVTMGFGDAVDLVRHGARTLRLTSLTTIQDVAGLNVVGRIPAANGDEGRRLNVSAHYDSVPAGGAAADNATGTACALEVARALARQPLEMGVDVVLFSAEEIGLNGAAAYAGAHAEALGHTELGIYYDGQGDFLGRHNIHLLGQSGLVDLVRARIDELDYRADVQHHFTGLDNAYLSAAGVPTLWFQRGPQLTWHTAADVTEDVSPRAMRESIAAAVHIARHVAAHPGCFPAGIPDDQMQELREYVAKGVPAW